MKLLKGVNVGPTTGNLKNIVGIQEEHTYLRPYVPM